MLDGYEIYFSNSQYACEEQFEEDEELDTDIDTELPDRWKRFFEDKTNYEEELVF